MANQENNRQRVHSRNRSPGKRQRKTHGRGEAGEEQQDARPGSGDEERDQAMEQWLRRVPDDPSGLLREKFRYESRQRQEQGVERDDEAYW